MLCEAALGAEALVQRCGTCRPYLVPEPVVIRSRVNFVELFCRGVAFRLLGPLCL